MTNRGLKVGFAFLLGVVALCGIALVGAGAAIGLSSKPALPMPASPFFSSFSSSNAGDLQATLESIYAANGPSIVELDVTRSLNRPGVFVTGGSAVDHSLGSGFVWDTRGDIVTNNHVVAGADRIDVTLSDGTVVGAKLVGTDADSDLAVVRVDAPADELHPVSLGDSSRIKVGQLAVAIGNPFGHQTSMSLGIISAVGRSLPATRQVSEGPTFSIPDIIQTDAPINPGSSGGILLDLQGNVIGVTSAFDSAGGTSSGIGFAIPSAMVARVVPVLISAGHFDHPYLGIQGATLTPSLAQAMGLKPDQRGALVTQVAAEGPAAKAGVRGATQQATIDGLVSPIGGDVIIAMDGQPIRSSDDLAVYLAGAYEANQQVALTILRDSQVQVITVTLAPRPAG